MERIIGIITGLLIAIVCVAILIAVVVGVYTIARWASAYW